MPYITQILPTLGRFEQSLGVSLNACIMRFKKCIAVFLTIRYSILNIVNILQKCLLIWYDKNVILLIPVHMCGTINTY